MKKFLFRAMSMSLLVCGAMIFATGCRTNEEEEINPTHNAEGERLIKKITCSSEDYIFDFTYYMDGNIKQFSTGENTIVIIEKNSNILSYTINGSQRYSDLNEMGYVIAVEGCNFNYYSTGELKSRKIGEYYNTTYTWDKGNMIKSFGQSIDGTKETRTYTYSSIKNSFNLDFFAQWEIAFGDILGFTGFLGNKTSNLIEKIDVVHAGSHYTISYNYTFDDEGNVTTITKFSTYTNSSYQYAITYW
ncbi:MAG: hypothetical protein PHU62_10470 [Bacteroidales bacterium]|nr:hypothetical protein [Bacteroidales bacterium]MDD4634972.1 hypothetical protein [Bacteroidales bacterium]